MKVKICTPIPAVNIRETLRMIQSAEVKGADIVEVRFDYMSLSEIMRGLDKLVDIVKCCSVPLIATNRVIEQGGRCCLSEDQRLRTLIKAAEAGFTYVDVELTTRRLNEVVESVKNYGSKVIVSLHDFNHTPSILDMERIVKKQMEAGADICKIITMANNITDNINCLIFTYEMSKKVDLICFAMGNRGLLSRVLSPLFGASFTYASLEEGAETAPGQITIGELREIYRRLGVEV